MWKTPIILTGYNLRRWPTVVFYYCQYNIFGMDNLEEMLYIITIMKSHMWHFLQQNHADTHMIVKIAYDMVA